MVLEPIYFASGMTLITNVYSTVLYMRIFNFDISLQSWVAGVGTDNSNILFLLSNSNSEMSEAVAKFLYLAIR